MMYLMEMELEMLGARGSESGDQSLKGGMTMRID